MRKNDFLLVRNSKGKLILREITACCIAGQQEPKQEVLCPGSKQVSEFQTNRMQVFVYRKFREQLTKSAKSKGLSIGAGPIRAAPGMERPVVSSAEIKKRFPSQSDTTIRKKLKHCADFVKTVGDEGNWCLRLDFSVPGEEELRNMVPAELVCRLCA